jgi:DNA-binding transcriptional LysR family regulator
VIDSRRLRTLRAVADHGTVTAAAAALYLTPSAVSQQLAALEQEVGHRVLMREGRGVRLTAAGEILLHHSNAVLAQLELAQAELAAYAGGRAGEVTVASFATGIAAVVAPAMKELAHSAPGIRLRVKDAEGDASLMLVLDGRADLAVAVEYRGAPGEDDLRLSQFPLYAEPFDAVLSSGHRLAGQSAVAVADLAHEPWIGPYPGNPCHDVVMLACESAGFQPRLAHSSDDFRAVAALAGAGAGVALVPRSALRGVELPGVVTLPLAGTPATRRVFAAVRRGAQDHPLHRPVLDALRSAAAQAHSRAAAEVGKPCLGDVEADL